MRTDVSIETASSHRLKVSLSPTASPRSSLCTLRTSFRVPKGNNSLIQVCQTVTVVDRGQWKDCNGDGDGTRYSESLDYREEGSSETTDGTEFVRGKVTGQDRKGTVSRTRLYYKEKTRVQINVLKKGVFIYEGFFIQSK